MKYVTVQIFKANYGKSAPIEHKCNKEIREDVPMEDIPDDKLALVKHGLSLTINLGDYSSAKVEVGIELPCHIDDVNKTFDDAAVWSSEKLVEEVETLNNLKAVFGKKK